MSKSNLSNREVNTPKHIYVLDAPSLERDRLTRFLEQSSFQSWVFSTPSAFFQEKGIHQNIPSVLLSNIELPNMSGLDILERIKINQFNMPVIFYGKSQVVPQGVAAVKQGALNFLLMPADEDHILHAIEDGLNLSLELLSKSPVRDTLQKKLSILSPREQEVFYLLIKGYSNAELVSALGISLDTVKQYKTSLMRKLEAKSLSQLMSLVSGNVGHIAISSLAGEGMS